ncbi:MAG: hypothetical protein KA444_04600 [Bacteroidia bacterium]|nr:hypothetical protein [Bacteroidia bacterium]
MKHLNILNSTNSKKLKFFLVVLPFVILSFSCKKETETITPDPTILEYLHISHTRKNINPFIDSTTEKILFQKYDMLWLGGDLAQATSIDNPTMSHIDAIFNIWDPNTLWAVGNHDYSSLQRVEAYTNRKPYYAYYKNGITIIVLDTQDSLSSIVGDQKLFFDNVVDTIQTSSHLVILLHKLIWMHGHPALEAQITAITNGGSGPCFHCVNPNNFYTDIYPKLVLLKNKGINVICISGDIGFNVKEFTFVTDDHITFLASGINSEDSTNMGLIFYHNLYRNRLSWVFVPTSDL